MIATCPAAAFSPFSRRPARLLVVLAALLTGFAHNATAFQVYIESAFRDTFALEVEANDTVLEVKSLIEDLESVAVEDQVLLFNAQTLENDQTLDSYGIEEGSTITLSVPTLEAQIRRLQGLIQSTDTLSRRITASLKSFQRARTRAAFNRGKKRLRKQIGQLDSLLVSTGEFAAEFAEARRDLKKVKRLITRSRFR